MRVTSRDLEIVRFILEMKFATITDIHTKFFKYRNDGKVSESEWYARERLRDLVIQGFLQSVRFRFENKCYYIGTEHGYWFVYNSINTSIPTAKPIKKIDIRTFEHDCNVLKFRLLLEEHEKVTEWQSDRQLKVSYYDYFAKSSTRDFCPDGVYKSVSGKLIAFEYELAQKSKKRYQDKILEYISCLQQVTGTDYPRYGHIHFVCAKESVASYLRKETAIFSSYFTIETQEGFEKRYQTQELLKTASIIPSDYVQ